MADDEAAAVATATTVAEADGGGGGGGGGAMAAEDDFDDGAMDFGVGDLGAKEQEQAAGGGPSASGALAAAFAGLTTTDTPAAAAADRKQEQQAPDTTAAAVPPLPEYLEAHAPEDLVCPITLKLLVDLVLLVANGITYSRAAIEAPWRGAARVRGAGMWCLGCSDWLSGLVRCGLSRVD